MGTTSHRFVSAFSSFATVCLVSARVLAGDAAFLELDGLSALYFESESVGSMIPASRIPIEVRAAAAGEWDLRIAQSDFQLPEIRYPSGARVLWRLRSDAHGICRADGPTRVCQLVAPGEAFVEGRPAGIPMTLTFSTEELTASGAGRTARREGVRLEPTSGYLQLVAVGINPPHAATAPGSPFFAVLSGRIVGVLFD
jgi:hypothetical protein